MRNGVWDKCYFIRASPWPNIFTVMSRQLQSVKNVVPAEYWPSSMGLILFSSVGRISVRKPRRPRLMPSTGTSSLTIVCAACSKLPSPPMTMSRSQRLPSSFRWMRVREVSPAILPFQHPPGFQQLDLVNKRSMFLGWSVT